MARVHATNECAMAFAKNDLSNDLNNEQCTTKMQRQQKPALRSQSYLYSIEVTVQSIKHTRLSPSCRNNNDNHAYARRLKCQKPILVLLYRDSGKEKTASFCDICYHKTAFWCLSCHRRFSLTVQNDESMLRYVKENHGLENKTVVRANLGKVTKDVMYNDNAKKKETEIDRLFSSIPNELLCQSSPQPSWVR